MEFEELIFNDYKEAKEYYPKLKSLKINSNGQWEICGDFDVVDDNGYCWDTYSIKIIFPKLYPYDTPILIETSNKVKQELDWHNQWGICCTGTKAKIFHTIGSPISLKKWIQVFVHSFFANHIVRLHEGEYPIGEYAHFGEGILQSYYEIFNTDSTDLVLKKLYDIQNYRFNSKNRKCKCGSGKKHKRCYLRNLSNHNFDIPILQIIKDSREIQKLKSTI